jgi:hypothetical protein
VASAGIVANVTRKASAACILVPGDDLNCAFNTCELSHLEHYQYALQGLKSFRNGRNHLIWNVRRCFAGHP